MDPPPDDENATNHVDIFSPQLMRHIAQLAGEAVYTTYTKKFRCVPLPPPEDNTSKRSEPAKTPAPYKI